MVARTVYFLCALTSGFCAYLLTRGYRRTGEHLLLWSAWCFILLAVSNVLLVVDLALFPTALDLSLYRTIPAFIGVTILLAGLIWESK